MFIGKRKIVPILIVQFENRVLREMLREMNERFRLLVESWH